MDIQICIALKQFLRDDLHISDGLRRLRFRLVRRIRLRILILLGDVFCTGLMLIDPAFIHALDLFEIDGRDIRRQT